MLEKPLSESGGGGRVSTTLDYARFCQMLANGGTLDGIRIIGRKTLKWMASDHSGPRQDRFPADQARSRFGLGFAVRTKPASPVPGSVGQFFWGGWPARCSGSTRRKTCWPSS